MDNQRDGSNGDARRVFEGMERVGLSGLEIAELTGVSPPTVSKWRRGKIRVPAETLAFLTLLLANRIEEEEILYAGRDGDDGPWHRQHRDRVAEATACLRAQEDLNAALAPGSIRDGARRFRRWWHANRGARRADPVLRAADAVADGPAA